MYYVHKLNVRCECVFNLSGPFQNKNREVRVKCLFKRYGCFSHFLGDEEVLCTPSCVEEICDLGKCLNILIFEPGIKSLIYPNLSSQWVFLFS